MGNDAELVERLKKQDRVAFSELVKEHQKPLYYLAWRWTQSDPEAQDIVQQTFVNAYEKIHSFQGRSGIGTWLHQIALNLLRNRARFYKNKKMEELDPSMPDTGESALEKTMIHQEAGRVLAVAGKLKHKQKTVLLLRLFKELPFKEIAKIVKCSENSAKVNYHYALKNLRKLLKHEGVMDALSA